jgi:prepilin-type N-terminal cleavage/methylation domain-containing protein
MVKRARGFTLIELLTVVAITAILSAMAAPAFKGLLAGQRVRATSTDLYAALVLARSEAIKRDTQVTLQPAATTPATRSRTTAPCRERRSPVRPPSCTCPTAASRAIRRRRSTSPSTAHRATAACRWT